MKVSALRKQFQLSEVSFAVRRWLFYTDTCANWNFCLIIFCINCSSQGTKKQTGSHQPVTFNLRRVNTWSSTTKATIEENPSRNHHSVLLVMLMFQLKTCHCALNKIASGSRACFQVDKGEEREALMWRSLGAALSSLPHSLPLSFYLCCPLCLCCNSQFYFPQTV